MCMDKCSNPSWEGDFLLPFHHDAEDNIQSGMDILTPQLLDIDHLDEIPD